MTRDGTVGRSDATEPNLAFHRDIDPARMMRPRFADSIRASSPSGLREQAGHMTLGSILTGSRKAPRRKKEPRPADRWATAGRAGAQRASCAKRVMPERVMSQKPL